jgi:hypothetical protein
MAWSLFLLHQESLIFSPDSQVVVTLRPATLSNAGESKHLRADSQAEIARHTRFPDIFIRFLGADLTQLKCLYTLLFM